MDTNEITRLILNLIRKGTIKEVDHGAAMCRVSTGELDTNWIKWTSLAAGETRDWNPPTVGEQVLLLSPGGDPADAVAIRGIYSDSAPAPSDKPTEHARHYPDTAVIKYDHGTNALSVTLPDGATVFVIAPGSVTIETGTATIRAQSVNIDAPMTTISGDVHVGGDLIASGVSLVNHVHTGVSAGIADTGAPKQ